MDSFVNKENLLLKSFEISVLSFPCTNTLPIINWIKLESKNKKENLKNKFFYFSHSYYCDLSLREKNISFINISGKKIISSYENKNLYLYQFHPELSGENGLNLLKKFKEL